ncbi:MULTISPECIES: hypothetical protein [Croceibacter]|jgi:hypothetical protein|nr:MULTISPECIES: hypothetical protein [Croceibacter]WSP33814.1 hypothetical protein VVL01_10365 [Croceibacter atlanticus]|tara:strand:+ start:222 stop:368 length:147 start_codon:yes stop_codon:yes gene_type:complete
MKKLLYTFALTVFAFSFAACEADELPQDVDNGVGDQVQVPADREDEGL